MRYPRGVSTRARLLLLFTPLLIACQGSDPHPDDVDFVESPYVGGQLLEVFTDPAGCFACGPASNAFVDRLLSSEAANQDLHGLQWRVDVFELSQGIGGARFATYGLDATPYFVRNGMRTSIELPQVAAAPALLAPPPGTPEEAAAPPALTARPFAYRSDNLRAMVDVAWRARRVQPGTHSLFVVAVQDIQDRALERQERVARRLARVEIDESMDPELAQGAVTLPLPMPCSEEAPCRIVAWLERPDPRSSGREPRLAIDAATTSAPWADHLP